MRGKGAEGQRQYGICGGKGGQMAGCDHAALWPVPARPESRMNAFAAMLNDFRLQPYFSEHRSCRVKVRNGITLGRVTSAAGFCPLLSGGAKTFPAA
jgi:hypothetical protein